VDASSREPRASAPLRGFGPAGLFAFLLIVLGNVFLAPLGALLVLAWAHVSGTPWSDLGFSRPRSWMRTALLGIAFGVAFKLLMKAVVMPLLGADPVNHAYHYLAHNPDALPGAAATMIVTAGFGEETVYRGYLFERLHALWGNGSGATWAIVVLTAVLFGAAHYSGQGLAGAEQAALVGLVFGAIFASTRAIWFLMIAHAAFDLTAVAIIFWDLEIHVSHWFFK
jgi:membrane protease YdiL (CAAX protease family)